jgi:hypothetical protein
MGKWTKESHGFSMLRSMAEKLLNDPKKKSRIWSEAFGAWGFFGEKSQEDEFLFWSTIDIGDRIHLGSFGFEKDTIAIVIDVWDSTEAKRYVKLMLNDGKLIQLSIEEGRMFRLAWQFIS